ncbi:hypothetical protein ACGTNG_02520 [Halomonas sp. 1390]|uniref:hypothetical protein n=1 Tax=Halomonas sp. B23F22_3 TaxID=3459516 RepID=UPI00373F41B5
MSFFLSVFFAVSAACFAAWFQNRSWKKREDVRFEERERDSALKIVSEFSELSSKRLYRQKRYLWAVSGGDEDVECKDKAEYRKVLLEWNDRLRSILVSLGYSFGDDEVAYVERTIQAKFVDANRLINLLYEGGGEVSKTEIDRRLDVLGADLVAFNKKLLRRVREDNFSSLPLKTKVCFSNRKNLSFSYLFFRLFGL